MENIRSAMEWASFALDVLGVAVIISGVAIATARNGLFLALFHLDQPDIVTRYKQQLVRGLLLGLDLMVAADVIKTAALESTLYNVATLGLLVIVRIALTWSLVVETEGRWPWQPARGPHEGDASGSPRDRESA